jgi:hypothetical protein
MVKGGIMKNIAGTSFMCFLFLAFVFAFSGCGSSNSNITNKGIDENAAKSCQNLFNEGKIIEAKEICESAADSYGDIQSNEADNVRFEAAVTSISSVLLKIPSDGQSSGLNTLGDVFNAFGVTASGRVPYKPKQIVLPRILPSSSPRGGTVQDFAARKIRLALEKSIIYLNKISKQMNAAWKEPFGGKQVVSDYGDVLALRAAARYLLGAILIESSYNLDANIEQAVNQKMKVKNFLDSNPGFLRMEDAQNFIGARSLLSDSAGDVLAAIDWMQTENGNTTTHLISLGKYTADQINEAKKNINDFKSSLASPRTFFDRNNDQIGTLDLTKFFGGVDFGTLLPTSTPGIFPDPTFDGIWTNYAEGRYDPNNRATHKGIYR